MISTCHLCKPTICHDRCKTKVLALIEMYALGHSPYDTTCGRHIEYCIITMLLCDTVADWVECSPCKIECAGVNFICSVTVSKPFQTQLLSAVD